MGLYATAIYIQPCQFHDRMKFESKPSKPGCTNRNPDQRILVFNCTWQWLNLVKYCIYFRSFLLVFIGVNVDDNFINITIWSPTSSLPWVHGDSDVDDSDVSNRDVGEIVMLVILWWWLIWNVGDRIIKLATFFVILVIFSMYQISHQHLKLVTNTFDLQHLSPTSM